MDPLVKFQVSNDSSDFLVNSLGMPRATSRSDIKGLKYNVYQGVGHATSQEELDDLREWIKGVLPESGAPSL